MAKFYIGWKYYNQDVPEFLLLPLLVLLMILFILLYFLIEGE